MEPNCEQRNSSTVAPQSLLMLNSQFVVDQSLEFAKRVIAAAGDDGADQVAMAYRLTLGREPSAEERGDFVQFLREQTHLIRDRLPESERSQAAERALASLCQALLGSNPFLYAD
jgi:hypothetical protein